MKLCLCAADIACTTGLRVAQAVEDFASSVLTCEGRRMRFDNTNLRYVRSVSCANSTAASTPSRFSINFSLSVSGPYSCVIIITLSESSSLAVSRLHERAKILVVQPRSLYATTKRPYLEKRPIWSAQISGCLVTATAYMLDIRQLMSIVDLLFMHDRLLCVSRGDIGRALYSRTLEPQAALLRVPNHVHTALIEREVCRWDVAPAPFRLAYVNG